MKIRVGGIDWLARWRHMRAETEAATVRAGIARGDDPWEQRAARFDRMSRTRGLDEPTARALSALVRTDDVVADVGAGTGRHVVPLARVAARVIAVEPSTAMRDRLMGRVRDEGLTNVEVVGERWPLPAGAIEADVVVSSHVLYAVDDVDAFVSAMDHAARRTCALVLGLCAPIDLLGSVWARLHGFDRRARPAALETLAVLHQLGYEASLELIAGTTRPFAFRVEDGSDIDELCDRLGVPGTDGARVREAVIAVGARADDGSHVLATSGPHALLAWAKS